MPKKQTPFSTQDASLCWIVVLKGILKNMNKELSQKEVRVLPHSAVIYSISSNEGSLPKVDFPYISYKYLTGLV